MAVPWHRIADLLGGTSATAAVPNLAAFARIPASPITGLHLWFDRQITTKPHAVMVGTISQWLFRDPINSANDSDEHYYQVVISASHQARRIPKAELVDRVVAELRQAFRGARDANLLRYRIVTDPNSVFSVRPEVDTLRPAARTALPWLHLAGDWIATGWPATMEGAVISGRMAASSLLEQEGFATDRNRRRPATRVAIAAFDQAMIDCAMLVYPVDAIRQWQAGCERVTQPSTVWVVE